MTAFLVILVLIIVIAAAALLIRLVTTVRRQEQLARRVRSTDLYGYVYPFLKKNDSDYVESVVLRPEYISIRTMIPYGSESRFTFAKHGLDNPTQDTLFALAQAAMLDMKALRNSRQYLFRTTSGVSQNGTRYNWYSYTMKHARKDELIRADARKRAENGPLVQEKKKAL